MSLKAKYTQALLQADHCVKCGLCLPYCPTYRLYRSENESPRGRIALAEALLSDQLAADDSLRTHIDRCLLCRACERSCPSGVHYSQIIDAARKALGRPGGLASWADNPLFATAGQLVRILHLPGLHGRLARALPHTAEPPAPGSHPPPGISKGNIGLLLGCTTRQQQAGALQATVRLLNHLGYTVWIPPDQGCCGALAAHQGDPERAAEQAHANQQAFGTVDTIVSIASACSLHLAETLSEYHPQDIIRFLPRALENSGLHFDRPDGKVAVHVPCSLHNGLGATDSLMRLLRHFPDLEAINIGIPGDCCGAGGIHLLTQRDQAQQLREPLLQQLLELQPRYLLTENIGCALHLAEGALAGGLEIEVLHPVELLARCLIAGASS